MRYSVVPYREIGNGVLSSVVFLTAFYGAHYAFWTAALCGGLIWLGYRLAIGTDLSLSELFDAAGGMTPEQAHQVILSAERTLKQLDDANKDIPCPELTEMLHEIVRIGHDIVGLLRRDTRDIRRARKFLTVYMEGVVNVSVKYAEVHKLSHEAKLEEQYRELLTRMIKTFRDQYDALMKDDELDLDVEIEVLNRRIANEGV